MDILYYIPCAQMKQLLSNSPRSWLFIRNYILKSWHFYHNFTFSNHYFSMFQINLNSKWHFSSNRSISHVDNDDLIFIFRRWLWIYESRGSDIFPTGIEFCTIDWAICFLPHGFCSCRVVKSFSPRICTPKQLTEQLSRSNIQLINKLMLLSWNHWDLQWN